MANISRRVRREFEPRYRRRRRVFYRPGYPHWQNQDRESILLFLIFYGALLLLLPNKQNTKNDSNDIANHIANVLTGIYNYCYHIANVLTGIYNYNYHIHIELSDKVAVFINYALRFLEIFWQVLILLLNCATYIVSCFLESILHLSTLLVAYFPGGIPGIAFVIVIAILVRKIHRLSQKCICMKDQQTECTRRIKEQHELYERCMQDKRTLQSKLDDTTILWREKTKLSKKLNQDLEKLRLSLEQERDERLCRICEDQIKTIVLLPCQHMCLCKTCLDRKTWRKCPMCRQHVDSTIEAYV